MRTALRYAARSDVGLVRFNNQDSGYAGPNLLAVADGMGGHAGGDVASAIAIGALLHLDTVSPNSQDALQELRRSIAEAHQDLVAHSHSHPELEGMGTTVTALLRSGNRLAMAHLGDSRAYLLRDGELTQVTTDHTFVQHLVDTGRISPEEAEMHPQRNVVMRVLGDFDIDLTPDLSIREAQVGDRWLLCSDGLSGFVGPEEIADALLEITNTDACADQLVDLALDAGSTDNVTVVLADVVDADEVGPGAGIAAQIVGSAAAAHAFGGAPPAAGRPGDAPATASRPGESVAGSMGEATDADDAASAAETVAAASAAETVEETVDAAASAAETEHDAAAAGTAPAGPAGGTPAVVGTSAVGAAGASSADDERPEPGADQPTAPHLDDSTGTPTAGTPTAATPTTATPPVGASPSDPEPGLDDTHPARDRPRPVARDSQDPDAALGVVGGTAAGGPVTGAATGGPVTGAAAGGAAESRLDPRDDPFGDGVGPGRAPVVIIEHPGSVDVADDDDTTDRAARNPQPARRPVGGFDEGRSAVYSTLLRARQPEFAPPDADPAGPTGPDPDAADQAAEFDRAAEFDDEYPDETTADGSVGPAPAPARRHRRGLRTLITLVLVAAVAAGCWAGYRWTQTQYYVGVSQDRVAVFQGIDAKAGPIRLSHAVEVTSTDVADLPEYLRDQVRGTIPASSLADARQRAAKLALVDLPGTTSTGT